MKQTHTFNSESEKCAQLGIALNIVSHSYQIELAQKVKNQNVMVVQALIIISFKCILSKHP